MSKYREDEIMFRTPEDFKKSKYILGKYRIKDLLILIGGFTVSFILVYVFFSSNFIKGIPGIVFMLLIAALPGALGAFLTLPNEGFHNVMGHLHTLYLFQSKYVKRYGWSGRDYSDFLEDEPWAELPTQEEGEET